MLEELKKFKDWSSGFNSIAGKDYLIVDFSSNLFLLVTFFNFLIGKLLTNIAKSDLN